MTLIAKIGITASLTRLESTLAKTTRKISESVKTLALVIYHDEVISTCLNEADVVLLVTVESLM